MRSTGRQGALRPSKAHQAQPPCHQSLIAGSAHEFVPARSPPQEGHARQSGRGVLSGDWVSPTLGAPQTSTRVRGAGSPVPGSSSTLQALPLGFAGRLDHAGEQGLAQRGRGPGPPGHFTRVLCRSPLPSPRPRCWSSVLFHKGRYLKTREISYKIKACAISSGSRRPGSPGRGSEPSVFWLLSSLVSCIVDLICSSPHVTAPTPACLHPCRRNKC